MSEMWSKMYSDSQHINRGYIKTNDWWKDLQKFTTSVKKVKCICGKNLVERQCSTCYIGNGIVCDRCGDHVNDEREQVYHCKDKNNDKHKHGYDLCMKCVDKYGVALTTIKLQEHRGGTKGVIGIARSKGWWSNHNHKYRVIWRHKQNSKWKELCHSDDLNVIKKKYEEYMDVIKWKERTQIEFAAEIGNKNSFNSLGIIYQGYLHKESLHVKMMRKRWINVQM